MIGDESPAPEFREKYQNDPQVKRWVDMAMRIEGTNKTFGVHAAGVVIAADPSMKWCHCSATTTAR